MADFDPFANQGGPAAWDPEHASDVKKQAEELSRRIAADGDEMGSGPATFSADDDADLNDSAEVSDDDELPDGTP